MHNVSNLPSSLMLKTPPKEANPDKTRHLKTTNLKTRINRALLSLSCPEPCVHLGMKMLIYSKLTPGERAHRGARGDMYYLIGAVSVAVSQWRRSVLLDP